MTMTKRILLFVVSICMLWPLSSAYAQEKKYKITLFDAPSVAVLDNGELILDRDYPIDLLEIRSDVLDLMLARETIVVLTDKLHFSRMEKGVMQGSPLVFNRDVEMPINLRGWQVLWVQERVSPEEVKDTFYTKDIGQEKWTPVPKT